MTCKLPGCTKQTKKRAGVPKVYCSPEHAKQGSNFGTFNPKGDKKCAK